MTPARARRLAGLLVAAGRGERFGAGAPKQFQLLGGRPLFEHAARVLHASPLIEALYVVTTPGWEARVQQMLADAGCDAKLGAVLAGGATRQESVERGLAAIEDCTHVLVHDAARPFLTARLVSAAASAAFEHGAATIALPVGDTLMRAERQTESAAAPVPACAAATLHRDGVWSVQTPQAFDLELLREAHAHARRIGLAGTDDGGLVLALGRAVALVPGNWWNFKVTRRTDLERAERLWAQRAALLMEEDS